MLIYNGFITVILKWIYLFLKFVLVSNTMTIDRYKPHKQKQLVGVLDSFKDQKGPKTKKLKKCYLCPLKVERISAMPLLDCNSWGHQNYE